MTCPHDVVLLSFGPDASCRLRRGVVPAAAAVAAILSVLMSILATEDLAILSLPWLQLDFVDVVVVVVCSRGMRRRRLSTRSRRPPLLLAPSAATLGSPPHLISLSQQLNNDKGGRSIRRLRAHRHDFETRRDVTCRAALLLFGRRRDDGSR